MGRDDLKAATKTEESGRDQLGRTLPFPGKPSTLDSDMAEVDEKKSPPIRGKVLILVENLSAPFDRRVWREATSLRRANYQVTVISPKGVDRDRESRATIDGIRIYRYRPFEARVGLAAYAVEFAHAMMMTLYLSVIAFFERGFDVIHICNPPDLLFIVTLPYKLLGRKVIFDHHDLSPEVYIAKKGGGPPGIVYKILLWLEKLTFASADLVVTTNESYRKAALSRVQAGEKEFFVVRNGPSLDEIREAKPLPELRKGRKFLITYVGIMGALDGVDILLHSIKLVAEKRVENDFHVVLLGDGPEFSALKRLAEKLEIAELLTFKGRVSYDMVLAGIATADVCVCPDPDEGTNAQSTLAKVLEYMSIGKPLVAFDLTETRTSAGEAALYASNNDADEFASHINTLLDSPELRKELGEIGRKRIVEELAWDYSEKQLLAAYEAAFQMLDIKS